MRHFENEMDDLLDAWISSDIDDSNRVIKYVVNWLAEDLYWLNLHIDSEDILVLKHTANYVADQHE